MRDALSLAAVAGASLGGVLLRARDADALSAKVAELRSKLELCASPLSSQGMGGAIPAHALPWLRLPVHAASSVLDDDMDLSATLAQGRRTLSKGLLARAHGGGLVVSSTQGLAHAVAARLSAHLDESSQSSGSALDSEPSLIVAIDDGREDDEPVATALLDRLGLWITLDGEPAAPQALPVDHASWQRARHAWRGVTMDDVTLQALVEAADALGVASLRAVLHAATAARAHAALEGRAQVAPEDAQAAIHFVLLPRATQWPTEATPNTIEDTSPTEDSGNSHSTDEPSNPNPQDSKPSTENDASNPTQDTESLADKWVEAVRAALPPEVFDRMAQSTQAQRSGRARQSEGRKGATQASLQRGRLMAAAPGDPRRGMRLSVIDTLRAAVPWQTLRRRELAIAAASATQKQPTIIVRRSDLRVQRRQSQRGTTTIFVVDASGSQAMHRLGETKGAVEALLAQCYVRRDKVAVIGFRGSAAQLLLSPTRSLVRARRQLAGLPGGGGTPLAAGLEAAAELATAVLRAGSTPWVVVLTDAKANIARDGTPGRNAAWADALSSAQALRATGASTVVIDTSAQPSTAARALSHALLGRYVPLPRADAAALAGTVHRLAPKPSSTSP
jgi:magnesium chelatase subunit D